MLLKIDVQEMENGAGVAARLRGQEGGGIPWMTILDGEGTELANSDGPNGNIGCPISEQECGWFTEMIRKSAVNDPEETASGIAAALEEYASSRR